jgi:hypothetical protein
MSTVTLNLEAVKPHAADSVSGRAASPAASPASSPLANWPMSATAEKRNFYAELKDLTDGVFIAVGELKSRHRNVSDDAVISTIVGVFISSGFADEWFPMTELFSMLCRHFPNVGPIAIEKTLNTLHRLGRIDIWWNVGSNELPSDYEGPRPRSGLFQMAVDFIE